MGPMSDCGVSGGKRNISTPNDLNEKGARVTEKRKELVLKKIGNAESTTVEWKKSLAVFDEIMETISAFSTRKAERSTSAFPMTAMCWVFRSAKGRSSFQTVSP